MQALSSYCVPDLPKEKLIVSIYYRISLIHDRDVNEYVNVFFVSNSHNAFFPIIYLSFRSSVIIKSRYWYNIPFSYVRNSFPAYDVFPSRTLSRADPFKGVISGIYCNCKQLTPVLLGSSFCQIFYCAFLLSDGFKCAELGCVFDSKTFNLKTLTFNLLLMSHTTETYRINYWTFRVDSTTVPKHRQSISCSLIMPRIVFSYHQFIALPSRGPDTHTTAQLMDDNGVLFYNLIDQNAIGCWNSRRPFTRENQGVLDRDDEGLIFPSDIKVRIPTNCWGNQPRDS